MFVLIVPTKIEDETENCPSGNTSAVGVSILPGIPYVLSFLGVSKTSFSLAVLVLKFTKRKEINRLRDFASRLLSNQITWFLFVFSFVSSEPYFLFLELNSFSASIRSS